MSRFMAAIYDWGMREVESTCLSRWRSELLAEGQVELRADDASALGFSDDSVSVMAMVRPSIRGIAVS